MMEMERMEIPRGLIPALAEWMDQAVSPLPSGQYLALRNALSQCRTIVEPQEKVTPDEV